MCKKGDGVLKGSLFRLVFVFIILFLIGGCAKGSVQPNELAQIRQETQSTLAPIDEAQPTLAVFHHSETMKQAIAKGLITEAEQNKYYPYKKFVVLKNKDLGIRVEDFTEGYDLTSVSGVCRLWVDVTLDNPSEKEINWNSANFKAIDSQGYSYSPAIYGVRGDLSGVIPPGKLVRCQVVFDIPPVKQDYALVYTDPDSKEQVNFTLDIDARNNEIHQEQAAQWAKGKEVNKEKYAKQEEEQRQLELQRQKDQEQLQQNLDKAKEWKVQQVELQNQKSAEMAKELNDFGQKAMTDQALWMQQHGYGKQ